MKNQYHQIKQNKKTIFFKNKILWMYTIIPIKLRNKKVSSIKQEFLKKHKKLFGFNYTNRKIFIDSIELETFSLNENFSYISKNETLEEKIPMKFSKVYCDGNWINIKKFNSTSFSKKNFSIKGPAIFCDYNTSIFVEKGWYMKKLSSGDFILKEKLKKISKKYNVSKKQPLPRNA